MKYKITMPNGCRVVVDEIVAYWAMNERRSSTGCLYPGHYLYLENSAVWGWGDEDSLKISSSEYFEFDTSEERDAFLARLDNYFEEIE